MYAIGDKFDANGDTNHTGNAWLQLKVGVA
jgi:hypothetical protein